jgi:hypothetical protein
MSDASKVVKGLKERLADGTEDRLGKALTDLLENPVLTGVVGAAFDARERAAQAQEVAMGAFNIPSAADIERLTRRLRSFSQRLEGIEDGVSQIDRSTGQRLGAIEQQLKTIAAKVDELAVAPGGRAGKHAAAAKPAAAKPMSGRARKPTSKAPRAGGATTRAKPKSSKA